MGGGGGAKKCQTLSTIYFVHITVPILHTFDRWHVAPFYRIAILPEPRYGEQHTYGRHMAELVGCGSPCLL